MTFLLDDGSAPSRQDALRTSRLHSASHQARGETDAAAILFACAFSHAFATIAIGVAAIAGAMRCRQDVRRLP